MRNYVTLNHTGVDKLFPHSLKSEQTTCFGSALDRYFTRQVMCMLYLFRLVGLDGWADVSRNAPVIKIVIVLPTDMHWYVESSIDRHEKGVGPFDAEHLGAPVRKSTFSVKFSSWIRNPRWKWLLPIEISRALEHAHMVSVQVVQGWLCQEFLCVQINEKLRLTKGNGDQGFKNGIDHVQNLSRSMLLENLRQNQKIWSTLDTHLLIASCGPPWNIRSYNFSLVHKNSGAVVEARTRPVQRWICQSEYRMREIKNLKCNVALCDFFR